MRVSFLTSAILLESAILALGAGCASERTREAQQAAMMSPATASSELRAFEKNLSQARQDQLDLLSPHYFLKANQAYHDAQSDLRSGESTDKVLNKISEGQADLARAQQYGAISQSIFGTAQQARNQAAASNANKYFQKDFENADTHFVNMTHQVEQGKTKFSQNDINQLQNDYKNLEYKGLKQSYLGDTLKLVNAAKDNGAEKWAPKTLATTQRDISKVESQMQRNREDKTEIARLANRAYRDALLLNRVTAESKQIGGESPEDVALRLERQRQMIASLSRQRFAQEQSLNRQEAAISALQSQAQANQNFKQIQSFFTPDEADVIRTDNKVVIRLKGLQFPTAKSGIPSSDFALLNKVNEIIAQFGKGSNIIVEGHTDSTGSAERNQKLSNERAESVRDFIVAAGAVPAGKVKAEGKGFSAPIASNKNSQGRSENRRVDVIIESMTA